MPYLPELVVIHRAFRRESAVLPRLVAAAKPGDIPRARRITHAILEYAEALHHHLHAEDVLIWPRLHARARLYGELITAMEAQHDRLDGTITAIDALLPQWTADPRPEVRAALIDAFATHREFLLDHLDDEETHAFPLITEHLTAAEWAEVTRESRPRTSRALGAVLEDATPEERHHFLTTLPVTRRLAWHTTGRRSYQRHVTALRGA